MYRCLVGHQRRLGAATRASSTPRRAEPATPRQDQLTRYIDAVAAHPHFVAADAAEQGPFLRAAASEVAVTGHAGSVDWHDALLRSAVDSADEPTVAITEMIRYTPLESTASESTTAAEVYAAVSRACREDCPDVLSAASETVVPRVIAAAAAAGRPVEACGVVADLVAGGLSLSLAPPGTIGPLLSAALEDHTLVSSDWVMSVSASLCVAGYRFAPAELAQLAQIAIVCLLRNPDADDADDVYAAVLRCAGGPTAIEAAVASCDNPENAATCATFFAVALAADGRFVACEQALRLVAGAGCTHGDEEASATLCRHLVEHAAYAGQTRLAASVMVPLARSNKHQVPIEPLLSTASTVVRACAVGRDASSAADVIEAVTAAVVAELGEVPSVASQEWDSLLVYATNGDGVNLSMPLDTLGFVLTSAMATPRRALDPEMRASLEAQVLSAHAEEMRASSGGGELPVVDGELWQSQSDSLAAKMLESAAHSTALEPSHFALRFLRDSAAEPTWPQLLSARGLGAAAVALHRTGVSDSALAVLNSVNLAQSDATAGIGYLLARTAVLGLDDLQAATLDHVSSIKGDPVGRKGDFGSALALRLADELGRNAFRRARVSKEQAGDRTKRLVGDLVATGLPVGVEGLSALAELLTRHGAEASVSRDLLFKGEAVQTRAISDPRLATVLLETLVQGGNFDAAVLLHKSFEDQASPSMLRVLIRGARTRAHIRAIRGVLGSASDLDATTLAELASAYARCQMHEHVIKLLPHFQREITPLTPQVAVLLVRSAASMPSGLFRNLEAIHNALVEQAVQQTELYTRELLFGLGSVVRQLLFKERRSVQAKEGRWAVPDPGRVALRSEPAVRLANKVYSEMRENEIAPSPKCCEAMMQLAGLVGDANTADLLLKDIAALGLKPTPWVHKHALHAFGAAGDLPEMMQHLAAVPDHECDLRLLTRAIHFAGHHRSVDLAMQVYDRVLELGFTPDDNLNNVLIHVVKVDAISVLLNAQRSA